MKRDLVAIGCSAGGIDALSRILQQLPADFPAAVLIVQHLSRSEPTELAPLLARRTSLPVTWAEQGAPVQPSRAYVAPPDVHLLVSDGHIRLTRAARENHVRPSIDKMFRSVASAYASRAIGVLLTGLMEDGVGGLCSIRDAGGAVIVQDPADAQHAELPARAVLALNPDRVLPVDAIGVALTALVGQPVPETAAPESVQLEAAYDRAEIVTGPDMDRLGKLTLIACPDCHGPMWQIGSAETRRYRCYLGHVTTARELLQAADADVESALWSAVRALRDRVTTLETLARDAKRIGNGLAAEEYDRRAKEARAQAELARAFMLDLGRATPG